MNGRSAFGAIFDPLQIPYRMKRKKCNIIPGGATLCNQGQQAI